MYRATAAITLVSLGAPLAACGGSAAFSDTISIKVGGIKKDEIRDGQASKDKSINTEEGNPYASFLRRARDALDGAEPSAIRVEAATLRVHADTKGVNGFEQVFREIELFLSDENTTIALGKIESPSGTSVEVAITADEDDLAALQPSLANGNVKVGIRGPTVAAPASDFDLKVAVEIVFEALE